MVLINPVAFPAPCLVHAWAIRNVLHANLPTGVQRDYSQDTRARLENAHLADAQKMRCRPGRNSHEHILMVVLESWSAYHSAYWSGLNDWTSRLDDIARSALSFMRFHAAGPNTMEGLMAMFTGRDFALPLARPYTAAPFESAWGLPDSLPRRLRLEGYHTVFLTSGNLGFTKTGEWLKDIGFNYVEGHDYSGYTGISRHHFESVPDDVLFNRALEFISLYDKDNPVFVVVETVSSHHPFLHPYTGERSEEAAIRYMDQAAADFIEALGARGYFNNGILVVVSDHRAMTIVPKTESQLLGKGAASQIPCFIMTGNNKERQVDRLFHQADLMPTLLAHVSSEFCYSGPIRDMIEPSNSETRCVLHARGDRRDHIDVICEEGSGTVVVDGDASRFVEVKDLSQDTQELMLDKIAWHRIQAETE